MIKYKQSFCLFIYFLKLCHEKRQINRDVDIYKHLIKKNDRTDLHLLHLTLNSHILFCYI